MREDLARLLEPRAPRPELRMAAVAEITRAGIPVGVLAMPVLPGITDDPKNLEAVAAAAARAGACDFAVNPLFLMPSAQKAFFPFLEEQFPDLVEKYRRTYERGAYVSGRYRASVQALAKQLRSEYRLTDNQREYPAEAFAPSAQLQLFQPEREPEGVSTQASGDRQCK